MSLLVRASRSCSVSLKLSSTNHNHTISSFALRRTMSDNVAASASFPVAASIRAKLQQKFEPSHLEVINESHMHKVPRDSETHFKVVVVSSHFENLTSLVQRHRAVHETLQDELENGPVHALSIVAKTPSQWQDMLNKAANNNTPLIQPSPACRGGDGTFSK